jgi:acetyl esterase
MPDDGGLESPAPAPPSRREIPWSIRARGRAARWLGRLPVAVQRLLSFAAPIRLDGRTLDPTLQLLLRLRPPEGAPLTAGTMAEARARHRHEVLSVRDRGPPPVGAVRELRVDGAAGPLRARHYAPADPAPPATLLVYFHGGGFLLGDLDTLDEPCRVLCATARQHVLSVEYRLAPEHPFPAPVDDALAAFRWAQAHASAFGVEPARVAVGGDSAGGNLAAVVAMMAARSAPPLAQLLVYPVVDRTRLHPSMTTCDGFFLSRDDCDVFAERYYGRAGANPADPRISPLAATDLAGLPPAVIVTAGFDVLRDEGEAYARALAAAGTRTELHREPSLVHGFMQIAPVSRGCREATLRLASRWAAFVAAR